jgi:hypothetical protein
MENIDNQLKAQVAVLESHVDLLEAERMHLHEMLINCGFPEGIKTLKATVEEYLSDEYSFAPKQKKIESM